MSRHSKPADDTNHCALLRQAGFAETVDLMSNQGGIFAVIEVVLGKSARKFGSNSKPFDQYAIVLPFLVLGLSQLGNPG